MAKIKASTVTSHKGLEVVVMCPSCQTICKPMLRLFSLKKKDNGLYFACSTLDCGFKVKANRVNFEPVRARK